LSPGVSESDRAIIRALQTDGRRPFSQIATEVGASEKTVRRRVAELRASGIIQITTVTNPRLLGFQCLALIGVHVDHSRPLSQVAADISAIPAVDYAVVVTGRYDLLVEVLCRDRADLLDVLETRLSSIDGVSGTETFPYLSLYYQQPEWEAAHRKVAIDGVGDGPVVLDDVDRALITALNADGRETFQSIADNLGVSESRIRQRVARLRRSGVMRVMAITNPRSLGFETTAWLGVRVRPETGLSEFAQRLAAIPSVAYLAVCAGRFDLLAEVVCRDSSELARLVEDDVRTLTGVERIELALCLDLHYEPVRPAF
jgi:Lrp/AsnC family transcriptional regulator for asnA, asnC and gidA